MKYLLTTGAGSFPRTGEGEQGQKLRNAFHAFDNGRISKSELREIERGITVFSIFSQQKAGLDLITDGLINWHDPVSHIMGGISGVQPGPMVRFFDTNTYFRQPVIKSKVAGTIGTIIDEFVFARSVSSSPVKPVLTGPYTLTRLSVNQAYANDLQLFEDVCHVIAAEVQALSKAGAPVIQIDEPFILHNPGDMPLLKALLEEIAAVKGDARLALYLYFGDASFIFEELQSLPVDILGLDFTYSRRLPEVIAATGNEKVLGLGIIDGRNTRMETADEVFPLLERIMALPGDKEYYLNPSCGLEYLPQSKAIAKLENMVKLRDAFMGDKHE
jgi:5-methyltetrahydropteroyltriglutamate--homocysteine methyltransferase